jgi:hypothetical protein
MTDLAQLHLDALIAEYGGLVNFTRPQVITARRITRLELREPTDDQLVKSTDLLNKLYERMPPRPPRRAAELSPFPYRIDSTMSLAEAELTYQKAISDDTPYRYDGPALDDLLSEVRTEDGELAALLEKLKGSPSLRIRLAEALAGQAPPCADRSKTWWQIATRFRPIGHPSPPAAPAGGHSARAPRCCRPPSPL